MATKHWTDAWAKYKPCAKGLAFAKSTKSIAEFWRTCKRGDWMLWMAGKACGNDRRKLTLAACECERLATLSQCADIVRKHYPKPPIIRSAK